MPIISDWHIHTDNSCDGACMRFADLLARAPAQGVRHFGISDHLHTPYNLPDVASSRAEFDSCRPPPNVHFGIELSVVSEWELAEIATGKHKDPVYGLRSGGPAGGALALGMGAAERARFGIEYVVGGTHWPMYVPYEREGIIRDYHRQNLFLATHPLITIVAHPWWWMGHWQQSDGMYLTKPWFDDFGAIPASLHDEFAAAAKQHGKVVEINLHAMLLNRKYPEAFKRQYCEYLARLQAAGVTLSIGSDSHELHYNSDLALCDRMLAAVGIRAETLWALPPRVA